MCEKAFDDGQEAACILFDFSNAFPTIARLFIYVALRCLNLPVAFCQALFSLYSDNTHYFKLGGRVARVFDIVSGVRQGCPASSIAFVLVTDCIQNFLRSQLPRVQLFAFADDLAAVTAHIWDILPNMCKCFEQIRTSSKLTLNLNKCKLIPLHHCFLSDIRELLGQTPWASISVTLSAKYLGIFVGPEAANDLWRHFSEKMTARVRFISSLPVGIISRVALYNMLAVPIARFFLQFIDACEKVVLLQRRLISKLASGPRGWLHPDVLLNTNLFIPHTVQPHDLRTEQQLAQLRTCIRHWQLLTDLDLQLQRAAVGDQRILCSGFCSMAHNSAVNILIRLMHYVHQLGLCNIRGQLNSHVRKLMKQDTRRDLNKHIRDTLIADSKHKQRLPSAATIRAKLLSTLRTRICQLSGFPLHAVTIGRLHLVISAHFPNIPPMVCYSVMQVWLNGFVTSHRMQADMRLNCSFCNHPMGDTLSHYIRLHDYLGGSLECM